MRALKPAKRYTLAVLFIFSQLQKALDDVAEIFIKTVRNLESTAKFRLEQYRLRHADQLQSLVSRFRDVLHILQDDELPAAARIERMRVALNDDLDSVLVQCNERIAQAGNHTFPFLLAPYQKLRSPLRCMWKLFRRTWRGASTPAIDERALRQSLRLRSCVDASATTLLRNTPIGAISISMVSPT